MNSFEFNANGTKYFSHLLSKFLNIRNKDIYFTVEDIIMKNDGTLLVKTRNKSYNIKMIENENKAKFEEIKSFNFEGKDIFKNSIYESKTVKILVCEDYYNEDLVLNNKNYLFVFGDNTKKIGLGGQAIIRNCGNTFGFITKLKPTNDEKAFLNDEMFDVYINYIDKTIETLKYILSFNNNYTALVFPLTGLGNGLAKMPEKAPKCYEYLKQRLKKEFNYEF